MLPAGHELWKSMAAASRSTPSRPLKKDLAVGERKPRSGNTSGSALPLKRLDVFPNPNPERDYLIHLQVPEFTCLCPLTGQPDFAIFAIDYIPDRLCVELKSLKLYTWSYRDEGAFHEAVTNRVLEDLASATRPRYMRVTARWGVRGGIFTNIVVEHRKRGWQPLPPVSLVAFESEASTR